MSGNMKLLNLGLTIFRKGEGVDSLLSEGSLLSEFISSHNFSTLLLGFATFGNLR